MKVISFSLWGQNKFFTYGAVENAILARELFPDWVCRFYIGRDVQDYVIDFLKSQPNVEVIHRDLPHSLANMFWRFEPLFDPQISVMLSRDADSRLSKKEQIIVNEWLSSDRDFHIIRDSPGHKKSIMGGLFGARNQICLHLKEKFLNYPRINEYGRDQKFLCQVIYPNIKDRAYVNDRGYYPNLNPTEIKRPMPTGYENIIMGDRIAKTPIASKIFNDSQIQFTRERAQ